MSKGIYKRSKEHIEKWKKSMLYYHHSAKTKRKISKAILARKSRLGYINSLEARKKLSKTRKRLFRENKLNFWNKGLSINDPRVYRNCIKLKKYQFKPGPRPDLRGKNHPNFGKRGKLASGWKGGVTPLMRTIRESTRYRDWRQNIFERDNYTCQNPNCQICHNKMGKEINVHHIKHFSDIVLGRNIKSLLDAEKCEELWDISNGITYCKKYHLGGKL